MVDERPVKGRQTDTIYAQIDKICNYMYAPLYIHAYLCIMINMFCSHGIIPRLAVTFIFLTFLSLTLGVWSGPVCPRMHSDCRFRIMNGGLQAHLGKV